MSYTAFKKKYALLIKKEVEINKYYDPKSNKKEKHRYLKDIYQEIKEDLENYGSFL